ncbi:transcriptional regulator [Maritimibacter sp. 55A14]|uniref:ArsR/SmtB family transcription factor n=1 Tax=Maritimibacter sp. 55A14 TaxID=2174844 RepID=UPI000D6224CD|nr:metalloregulator ArsR/SmtB family transcription factor [Maritimibacter sp. 55A14]PWE29458.1 transcriptional regulator [Maritimibacter sp. 55A14]
MKTIRDTSLSLEDAAQAFAALGSESRLSVLRSLVRAGPEGLSIGALGKATGISGATLTHHLRFLTQAGLVRQARQGRSIICAGAAYETVDALSRFLLEECCADAEVCAHEAREHGHD